MESPFQSINLTSKLSDLAVPDKGPVATHPIVRRAAETTDGMIDAGRFDRVAAATNLSNEIIHSVVRDPDEVGPIASHSLFGAVSVQVGLESAGCSS